MPSSGMPPAYKVARHGVAAGPERRGRRAARLAHPKGVEEVLGLHGVGLLAELHERILVRLRELAHGSRLATENDGAGTTGEDWWPRGCSDAAPESLGAN